MPARRVGAGRLAAGAARWLAAAARQAADGPTAARKPGFVDAAWTTAEAGRGGKGSLAILKLGGARPSPPNGGNGGAGGDVYVEAVPGMRHLGSLLSRYRAESGAPGGRDACYGKRGKDLVIGVPLGTWVDVYKPRNEGDEAWSAADERTGWSEAASEAAAATANAPRRPTSDAAGDGGGDAPTYTIDLSTLGERHRVAVGGKAGMGNLSKGSRYRERLTLDSMPGFLREKQLSFDSVRSASEGGFGEVVRLRLRLKTLADVGLVGEPNAGKSSLLRALSSARPAVADYPFTTVSPMVGSVACQPDGAMLSVTDIPGLLRDASKGRGMGIEFLRHVERAPCLAFVVDASARAPWETLAWLQDELAAYDPELANRPRLVVANKADLPGVMENVARMRARLPRDEAVVAVSALTGAGIGGLVAAMRRTLEEHGWSPADFDPVAMRARRHPELGREGGEAPPPPRRGRRRAGAHAATAAKRVG